MPSSATDLDPATSAHIAPPTFATQSPRRVGLVVPSSNTTMETEIPQLLADRPSAITFHSSRATLHTVDAESLAAMVNQSDRCAAELGDARVDVLAYACLVAVMAAGAGAHERIEARMTDVLHGLGVDSPVVSSAGALVRTATELGMSRVAIVAPYMPALTELVINYLQGYGIEVTDWVTLAVTDNCDVGRLDSASLPAHVERLNLGRADGIVLSACVQMPSLPAVAEVERITDLPVITAATATTREIIKALRIAVDAPAGGAALRSLAQGASR